MYYSKLQRKFSELLSWKWFSPFALAFACAAVFGNVLKGPFLFDDPLFITGNVHIRSLANIPTLLVSSTTAGAFAPNGNFYRPLQEIVYAFLYQIIGLQPAGYHFVSIFLHFCNACLIYVLMRQLKLSKPARLLAALLFLVHPVQTQAISYISGLADPLGLLFILLGLFAFKKLLSLLNEPTPIKSWQRRHYLWAVAVVVCQIFALLSKENTVIFWPLLVLFCIWYKKQYLTARIPYALIAVGIALTLLYLYLRFTVLNFTGVTGLSLGNDIYTQNLAVRLLTFVGTLPQYLLLVFFPAHLSYEKPLLAYDSVLALPVIAGFIVIVAAAYFVFRSYRQAEPQGFWLGWAGIALVPFSGLIPLNAIYLEHWLYVPMVGVVVLFGFVCDRLLKHSPRFIGIVLVLILCLLAARSITRNAQWADPEKFYLHEISVAPLAMRMHNNLGSVYSSQGKSEQAIYSYKRAIQLSPDDLEPRYNLAREYLAQKKAQPAFELLLSCLEIEPNFIHAHSLLADMFKAMNQPAKFKSFNALKEKIAAGGKVESKEIQEALARN